VFGSSAGAIIFGESIDLAGFEDENEIGLSDLSGFDMVRGMSVFCHYGNDSAERREESDRYLAGLSTGRRIAVLSEEITLFINDDKVEIIGDGHSHCVSNGLRYDLRRAFSEDSSQLNDCQHRFFEQLAAVQDQCVNMVMAQHKCADKETQSMLYEVTFDVIAGIMEVIDGYSVFSSDRHDIVNTVNGRRLNEDPCIELHDAACEYLKDE